MMTKLVSLFILLFGTMVLAQSRTAVDPSFDTIFQAPEKMERDADKKFFKVENSIVTGKNTVLTLKKQKIESIFKDQTDGEKNAFSTLFESGENVAFVLPVNGGCKLMTSRESKTTSADEKIEIGAEAKLVVTKTEMRGVGLSFNNKYYIQHMDIFRHNKKVGDLMFICFGASGSENAKNDLAKTLGVNPSNVTLFVRKNDKPAIHHVEAPDKSRGVAGEKD